ncbi:hypothetical protein Ctob_015325 [Chrysochromulina tobinii]|uniref:Uncharacterized protein n=1 Tax=Chrysochromulina tobinii TaxID=1460289 RepID=A0A0M0JZN6_9EUKA|nr:hypothetical protein Ctob_015325 [Chrysochromulina tobinii]|eukprot:KOO32010.1 hypothetical protein Ctob_015325 [Chrysochromulina sp. CCMP291]
MDCLEASLLLLRRCTLSSAMRESPRWKPPTARPSTTPSRPPSLPAPLASPRSRRKSPISPASGPISPSESPISPAPPATPKASKQAAPALRCGTPTPACLFMIMFRSSCVCLRLSRVSQRGVHQGPADSCARCRVRVSVSIERPRSVLGVDF